MPVPGRTGLKHKGSAAALSCSAQCVGVRDDRAAFPCSAQAFFRFAVIADFDVILVYRPDFGSEWEVAQGGDPIADRIPHLERRRVEIARALAANPKFILLDEPFAGVDPISVIDIKKVIEHLRDRGLGVLITDHNVRETLDVCEHAYIVSQGQLIAHGTPSDVLNDEHVKRVYPGDQFRL